MKKLNPGIYVDLDDIEVVKHVARAVGLATPGRLDKMATV